MVAKIRVGALMSGGGTNLQAIIDAARSATLAADIVFVGSDNPDAFGLQRARTSGIPTFVVDYRAALRSFRENPAGAKLPAEFRLDEARAKQTLWEADGLIDAAASFVAFGMAKNLPPATVDRVNQMLQTVYKGRFPEDATLDGLKKVLATKGLPSA